MIIVGISILCVSERLHLSGSRGWEHMGLKLLSWVRLARQYFITISLLIFGFIMLFIFTLFILKLELLKVTSNISGKIPVGILCNFRSDVI